MFQKTDDKDFFNYSFSKFVDAGFLVKDVSEDVNNGIIDNIITEYENKFRKSGVYINCLIATKQ